MIGSSNRVASLSSLKHRVILSARRSIRLRMDRWSRRTPTLAVTVPAPSKPQIAESRYYGRGPSTRPLLRKRKSGIAQDDGAFILSERNGEIVMWRSVMSRSMRKLFSLGMSVACLMACMAAGAQSNTPASDAVTATETETIYADVLDAYGAFSTIDSGLMKSYDGKDRQAWERIYREKREALVAHLAKVPTDGLSKTDARAVALMRASLSDFPADASTLSPSSKCQSAQTPDLAYEALRAALYSCFDELANNLQFEGGTVNRVSAFSLLEQIKEPERRKNLFLAFNPLWEAVNGKDQPDSPYRRLIRMASADAAKNKSAITAAAESLGVQPTDVESWLEHILETWRQVSGDRPIEPWDYRYVGGETGRRVDQAIPRGRCGKSANATISIWEPILKNWESCMISIPGRAKRRWRTPTCCDVAAW